MACQPYDFNCQTIERLSGGNNSGLLNFGSNNINANQVTSMPSIFNGNKTDNGLFANWNNQSTSNLFSGLGTMANIGFGLENLKMAKKSFGLQEEQHKAWMDDREEAAEQRKRTRALRF